MRLGPECEIHARRKLQLDCLETYSGRSSEICLSLVDRLDSLSVHTSIDVENVFTFLYFYHVTACNATHGIAKAF